MIDYIKIGISYIKIDTCISRVIHRKEAERERARRELEELGGVRKTALIQEEASIEDRAAATINRFELPVGTLSAR